jgi:purine-cytosine permease-like protein
MDNDIIKTAFIYIGIIILVIIAFRFILPLLLSLIGFIITLLMEILMWAAIIYVLYLLVKYLYENFNKNNG